MLIPGFHSFIRTIPVRFPFLDPQGRQFILHSVSHATDTLTGLYRHNGVFHEPGVFGLFLTIGLFFNYIVFKQVFNKYGIVFLVSVLTTFSTASFLALGILFLGFSYTAKRLKFLRYPVFVIIGGLF